MHPLPRARKHRHRPTTLRQNPPHLNPSADRSASFAPSPSSFDPSPPAPLPTRPTRSTRRPTRHSSNPQSHPSHPSSPPTADTPSYLPPSLLTPEPLPLLPPSFPYSPTLASSATPVPSTTPPSRTRPARTQHPAAITRLQYNRAPAAYPTMGRGKSWSREESEAVAKAWKLASEVITSARDQNTKRFTAELYQRFISLAPKTDAAMADGRWTSRSQTAVKTQFDAIADDIIKFNLVTSSVVEQAINRGLDISDPRILRAAIAVHLGAVSSAVLDFDDIDVVETDWKLFEAWRILKTCSRFAPVGWADVSRSMPPASLGQTMRRHHDTSDPPAHRSRLPHVSRASRMHPAHRSRHLPRSMHRADEHELDPDELNDHLEGEMEREAEAHDAEVDHDPDDDLHDPEDDPHDDAVHSGSFLADPTSLVDAPPAPSALPLPPVPAPPDQTSGAHALSHGSSRRNAPSPRDHSGRARPLKRRPLHRDEQRGHREDQRGHRDDRANLHREHERSLHREERARLPRPSPHSMAGPSPHSFMGPSPHSMGGPSPHSLVGPSPHSVAGPSPPGDMEGLDPMERDEEEVGQEAEPALEPPLKEMRLGPGPSADVFASAGSDAVRLVGDALRALGDALSEYNAISLFSRPDMQGRQDQKMFFNALAEKHALKARLDRDKLMNLVQEQERDQTQQEHGQEHAHQREEEERERRGSNSFSD